MWRTLSEQLTRITSGRMALAALIILLLFTSLVLPQQAQRATQAARGAGSPDMSFYYTTRDLYHMAEAYGEQGRAAYIQARFTFDVLWPLVYTFFLVTAISWLNRGAAAWIQNLNLLPLFAAAFDYLENMSTSVVMARYPASTAILDGLAPVFTLIKWLLVYASFAALLISLVAAGSRWLAHRSGRPA